MTVKLGRLSSAAWALMLCILCLAWLPVRAAPLNIVATTGMLADTVRAVGGERVAVYALMGSGVDPHAYRQTRSDIQRMTRADLVVWHGLHLEAQLDKFLYELGRHRKVVALTEVISKDLLHASQDYPGRYDPQVWMDPTLWRHVVIAARDTLIDSDPEGRHTYMANAQVFLAKLDTLDAQSREKLRAVPPAARVLVTAHDAFGYFGSAYNFEVLGIQGISTESEASLSQVERLVQILVDRKIKAIFIESSVADRNVRALVEGAAARGHTVRIGGELYSDAMGAPGTHAGTYLGMLEHNVTTIASALHP